MSIFIDTLEWVTRNFEWLFSGVAVAVPLAFFGWVWKRGESRKFTRGDTHVVQSVSSHNQSGGITAHTVNVQELRRSLPSGGDGIDELSRFRTTSVFLHRYSDSSEVARFSDDVAQLLRLSGWRVIESSSHIGDSSVADVAIEVNAGLQVGDESMEAASTLEEIFNRGGIAVQTRKLSDNPLPKSSLYLRVGPVA